MQLMLHTYNKKIVYKQFLGYKTLFSGTKRLNKNNHY